MNQKFEASGRFVETCIKNIHRGELTGSFLLKFNCYISQHNGNGITFQNTLSIDE